jgi:hypothetical protein
LRREGGHTHDGGEGGRDDAHALEAFYESDWGLAGVDEDDDVLAGALLRREEGWEEGGRRGGEREVSSGCGWMRREEVLSSIFSSLFLTRTLLYVT